MKSLFTSVPAKEATTAILETITSDSTFCERTKLAPRTLIALLNLCLTATNFKFRNEYYELTNGLAMGAPASPIIATIFMGKLEDRALATFDTPPRVWYRYVDVFSIVKRALVDKLLQHLNSQHPSIQFTVEVEKDGQLPYMDVTVSRDDQTNKLLTTVFRKPTHTGRYLHYTSHHPDSAKRSVVCSLAKRKKYITLSDQAVQAEEQQLRLDLTANGYPESVISKCTSSQRAAPPKPIVVDSRNGVAASIPYVKGLSEAIRRFLATLGIRTAMRTNSLKWTLMGRAKDAIPSAALPGVVYAIGCKDCPQVYVGETMRTASQRTKEHKSHARLGHPELSAVAAHQLNEGHAIHWEPSIVARERDSMKRKVREALVIHQLAKKDRTMNLDRGSDLSKLWLDLVQ